MTNSHSPIGSSVVTSAAEARQLLFARLRESGLSIAVVANLLETTELYLSEVAAGTRLCSQGFAERLAQALELAPDALVGLSVGNEQKEKSYLTGTLLPAIIDKFVFGAVLGIAVYLVQINYSDELDRTQKRAQVANSVSTYLNGYATRLSAAMERRITLFEKLSRLHDTEKKKRLAIINEATDNNREIALVLDLLNAFGPEDYIDTMKSDCAWNNMNITFTFDESFLEQLHGVAGDPRNSESEDYKTQIARLENERTRFDSCLSALLYGTQRLIANAVAEEYENATQ